MKNLPFAEQHRAHMGQRRQIAGGTYRAFPRDAGVDPGVDQTDKGVDHFVADARVAARQTVDFQDHHQPHRRFLHELAYSSGMGEDDGALQVFELAGRDDGPRQQAETGVDAVDHPALLDEISDRLHRGLDIHPAFFSKLYRDRCLCDRAQLRQGKFAGVDEYLGGHNSSYWSEGCPE
ncbi:MAG: hypothetical protein ACD_75C02110G0001, partial [uncultured bacterium]